MNNKLTFQQRIFLLTEKNVSPINTWQIVIGCGVLFVGVLVYLLDRQQEQVLFIQALKLPHLPNSEYKIFGGLGNNLPSFIHVYSFSLLTSALMLSHSRKNYYKVCIIWIIIDVLFEFGQLIGPFININIPEIINYKLSIPIIYYFKHGTFDFIDILFSFFGGFAAYLTLITTCGGETHD